MKFISTRGQTEPHSFSRAVAVGLAPDGGLFLPEMLPDLSPRLATGGAKARAQQKSADRTRANIFFRGLIMGTIYS